jgi:hypothetical protein
MSQTADNIDFSVYPVTNRVPDLDLRMPKIGQMVKKEKQ